MKIGEYLIARGLATETEIYEGLALQQNLDLGIPEAGAVEAVTCVPAEVSRRWRVLPFRTADGALYIAGTDPPCETMRRELSRFSSLEIRFRLITPTDWAALAEQHLPMA